VYRLTLFRRARNVAIVALALALGGVSAGVALPGGVGEALRGLGFVLAGAALVLAAAMYGVARRDQQRIDRMVGDNRAVRWRAGPEQWARAMQARRDGVPKYVRYLVLAFTGCGALIALLLSFATPALDVSPSTLWVSCLATGAASGGALGLSFRAFDLLAIRRQARHGGEILAGDAGLFVGGEFWPWRSWMVRLLDVTLTTSPDESLICHFVRSSKSGWIDRPVTLPVAPEWEGEAALVAMRFKELATTGARRGAR